MRIVFIFLATAITALAQTNSVYVWSLKSGANFAGDYFTSGALAVVIKSHGTNCILKISELTTNDWLYFQDCKSAQRQHQLDAEAIEMQNAGLIELSAKFIDSFPEKADERNGWMDATFLGLNSDNFYARMELGFEVKDKNGDYIDKCYSEKVFIPPVISSPDAVDNAPPNPLIPVVLNLKKGDKVRLIGKVVEGSIYTPDSILFHVQKVEMIQTAADAAQIEAVRQEAGQ